MQTILIVEDEDALIRLLRLMLRDYTVLEAITAQEAIQTFRDNGSVDLLIADVTLPTGSGIEVAKVLRQDQPRLPVILASGYPESTWNTRDVRDLQRLGSDGVAVVEKPFKRHELLELVQQLTGKGNKVERAGGGAA
jgi:CheY-like chemotaxis protein